MIDAVWLQVLQRVPTDYYDALAIITVTGAELVIQQVFKIERDFMVLRRTAGTGDLGRTIILAYGQIDFMAFNRKMSEVEVLKIFGEPMPEIERPQPVAYQPSAAAPPPSSLPKPPLPSFVPPKPAPVQEGEAVPEPAPEETAPAQKPGQVSKTILLARLRERLAEKAR